MQVGAAGRRMDDDRLAYARQAVARVPVCADLELREPRADLDQRDRERPAVHVPDRSSRQRS